MPLKPGEAVGTAIKELYNHGSHPRPRAQILAIAESNHRRHLALGGLPARTPMMGFGGARPPAMRSPHLGTTPAMHQQPLSSAPMANMGRPPGGRMGLAEGGQPAAPPFYERNAERQVVDDQFHPGGLIMSDVAGRSDRLPYAVAADSFVMPADTISGIGGGNTMAGAKIMDAITTTGPYGSNLPKIGHGSGPPKGKFAAGGAPHGEPISRVMLAGGEYLIPRDRLVQIGKERIAAKMSKAKTPLEAGHEWARNLVDEVRKHAKRFLAKAPKPKA